MYKSDVYYKEQRDFFAKHGGSFTCSTSPLDEYDCYHKTYVFEDGAVWYETMSPVFETAYAEVYGIKYPVEVKLLRTEYWSNEFGSRYHYDKY